MATVQPRCSVCGSTLFRLDRRSNLICCQVCGTPQNQQQVLEARQRLAASSSQAVRLIRVGSYAQAAPLLEQISRETPDDADVYYLHLMGLTNCFRDLLLAPSDWGALNKASGFYTTYLALGGRTDQFQRYRRKRLEAFRRLVQQVRRRALLQLTACALGMASLVLLLIFCPGLLSLLAMAGGVWLLGVFIRDNRLAVCGLYRLQRQLEQAGRGSDPFFRTGP